MAYVTDCGFGRYRYVLVAALWFGACAAGNAQQAKDEPKRLLAYYAMWTKDGNPSYTANEIPFSRVKFTHILHAFLWLDETHNLNKADSLYYSDPFRPAKKGTDPDGELLISKAHQHGVKVLISIGGGGRHGDMQAAAFAAIAHDTIARAHFTRVVGNFIAENGYDGVDIDWEVPGQVDSQACIDLIKALHDELEAVGSKLKPKRRLLLSMAIPAFPVPGGWGEGLNLRGLAPFVDFFNVMTYDLHNCSNSEHTAGHDSPLNGPWSMVASMALFERLGLPTKKLNIGIPFFGYRFDGVSSLGGMFSKCGSDGLPYNAVVATIKKEPGWEQKRDPDAGGAAFLVRAAPEAGWITYEDDASITQKVAVAFDRQIGGMFVWYLGQDYDNTGRQTLLEALNRAYEAHRVR